MTEIDERIALLQARIEALRKKLEGNEVSALQTQQPNAVEVRMQDLSPQYAEIMVLGKVLQMSGYFKDVRDQAQAVTKILFGRELGISPIQSMSAIHIIEGKPCMSSNLLGALIKRSGKYNYHVKVSTATCCQIAFMERDGDKWAELGVSEFTWEDAKAANLAGKDVWKKYGKAMLFARALSQGERTFCPDVSIFALYVPEELGADVNEAGEVLKPETVSPLAPKQVERTTAPIPISRNPVIETAQQAVKGALEKISEQPQGAVEPPQREPGDDSADETIDLPRSRALHRAFREAIKNPQAQKQCEAFLRDWLKHEGYVDAEGKGTTKTIPTLLFEEVKAKAVAFAEAMPKYE